MQTVKLNETPILEKDLHDDKVGILDLKVRLDEKVVCNVEMQVIKYANIEKRILYYWSKLYAGEIHEGQDYNKLNKTILILIADFELDNLKDIPKSHTKWEIKEEEFSKKVLTEMLELHIIELPKLIKALDNEQIDKNDKLQIWAKFLLYPEKVGEEDMKENEDIKEAKNELSKIQQDERERELARLRMKHIMDEKAIKQYANEVGKEEGRREGLKEGKKEGIKEGIKEGRLQKQLEIAKKMLDSKIKLEEIIKFTGLTREELEKIK